MSNDSESSQQYFLYGDWNYYFDDDDDDYWSSCQEETVPCKDCKEKGEITLFVNVEKCKKCNGKGRIKKQK